VLHYASQTFDAVDSHRAGESPPSRFKAMHRSETERRGYSTRRRIVPSSFCSPKVCIDWSSFLTQASRPDLKITYEAGQEFATQSCQQETITSSSLQGRLSHSALRLEAGSGIVRMTCVCKTVLHLALRLARLYVYKCRKLDEVDSE